MGSSRTSRREFSVFGAASACSSRDFVIRNANGLVRCHCHYGHVLKELDALDGIWTTRPSVANETKLGKETADALRICENLYIDLRKYQESRVKAGGGAYNKRLDLMDDLAKAVERLA